MVFDEKFDLIFSLGEDCACTSYLRRFNLQENSYPFDWLTKADFFTRVELLANDFRGFLEKENLVWLDKSAWKGSVDEHNDYYWDKGTDFYFYHDFAAQTPFDEAFAVVRQRYDRRIERLYERIRGAKKVLLVWWSRDKHQDFEAVKQAYERLCEKFSHAKIYMLLIEFGEQSQQIYSRAGGGNSACCDMIISHINTTLRITKLWEMRQTTPPYLRKSKNART